MTFGMVILNQRIRTKSIYEAGREIAAAVIMTAFMLNMLITVHTMI